MKTKRIYLIIAVLAVIVLSVCLGGCAMNDDESAEKKPLEAVVEDLYSGIGVPAYDTLKLDKSTFEFFTFIPYEEGLSAVAADALVNITPHSMVVIYAPAGNGAELAHHVEENADPNKWLCVKADAVRVAYTDHYVVLVMSDEVIANGIIENFKALSLELDGMEMNLLAPGI